MEMKHPKQKGKGNAKGVTADKRGKGMQKYTKVKEKK